MSIEIQFDVKIKTIKIYFLESQNRQLINEMFDKLHVQNRIKYIIQSTSHDYFVFVI